MLMFMPKLLPCKDAGVSDPSQRREVASAAMIIGLLMGVVGAMWWHVFVVPQFDLAGFAASTESTAVAFEVGYLVQFYEPAPAWLPTAVVFPGVAAIAFGVLGFSCARHVSSRSALSIGLEGGVVGGCLGVGAAAWATLSPPLYSSLTETRPLRIELASQNYLWIALPLCSGVTAAILSISVAAVLGKKSAATRRQREVRTAGP